MHSSILVGMATYCQTTAISKCTVCTLYVHVFGQIYLWQQCRHRSAPLSQTTLIKICGILGKQYSQHEQGLRYYRYMYPVSILRKSISGRHRPVRVADGPMTVRCRFM